MGVDWSKDPTGGEATHFLPRGQNGERRSGDAQWVRCVDGGWSWRCFGYWKAFPTPDYPLQCPTLVAKDPTAWITNTGSCPIPKDTLIDVKYQDGTISHNVEALSDQGAGPMYYSNAEWGLYNGCSAVKAWRPAGAAVAPEPVVPGPTPHVHAELIKAWADGAEIERWRAHTSQWISVPIPFWDAKYLYRIKPTDGPTKEQLDRGITRLHQNANRAWKKAQEHIQYWSNKQEEDRVKYVHKLRRATALREALCE